MCNRRENGGRSLLIYWWEGLVIANCNMMSTKVLTSLVVLCCLSAVWAMPGDLVLMKDGISMVKKH